MLILDDLWYGNIHPSDRTFRKNSEYAKHVETITQYQNQIKAQLPEQGQFLLDRLEEETGLVTALAECDSFASGFRTGVLLMLDVFYPVSEAGIEPL